MNDDPTGKKIVFNREDGAEALLEAGSDELQLPPATNDGEAVAVDTVTEATEDPILFGAMELPPTAFPEATAIPELDKMSPEQRKEYVAAELVKLLENGNREDLAAYMREVLSANEPLHPVERGVIFDLLEKAERAKIGSEINQASESAFKELSIDNNNKSNKESGFCYDASKTMIRVEDDHRANISSRLRYDGPIRPIMSNYDALRSQVSSSVKPNIESLIDTNQTDSTSSILDEFDSKIRKCKEKDESLDQTVKLADEDNIGETPDLFKQINPDVFDETVDSLVSKVEAAKKQDTSLMLPVMELLDTKSVNTSEAIAACEHFIKQYADRISETRIDIDRPAQEAMEKIEYFIKNARNAEFDARDLNDALAISGKQSEIISTVRGKIITINSLVHERQEENARRINQFQQTIDDLTRVRPAMSKLSSNAIQFNH